jgi:agmatine deiminase
MYPREAGFTMPPEWSRHNRSFLAWPVIESVCWPENYAEICAGFAEVANAISLFEPVTMLVHPDIGDEIKMCCDKVEIMEIEHNDSWMRDNGPTFVVDNKGQLAGVNWKFNAWGEKYSPWDLDDSVTPKLLDKLGIPRFDAPIIMEGGSLHVDGQGTLMTTEECLLNENRNPGYKKEDIEEILKQYLGIQKVIWLKRGLNGDETDGHVDNIACFARPGMILMQTCHSPEDANYEITMENLEILENTVDASGKKLEVIQIPQPLPAYYNNKRLTLSYLNFYFVNNGIILSVFGEGFSDSDQKAGQILQETFPERKIIKVDGMRLVKEGGNVHCITQQMPEGIPAVLPEEGL